MLNRSASLAMSTCVLKALPGKLDIKGHSPSILYILLIYMVIYTFSMSQLSYHTSPEQKFPVQSLLKVLYSDGISRTDI